MRERLLRIKPDQTREEYVNERLSKELNPFIDLIDETEEIESGGIREVDPDKKQPDPPPPPNFQP